MTSEQPPSEVTRARTAREAARLYDRGRPGYPQESSDWLVGGQARTVLELGAGTGQLTRHLVAAGHDVLATDAEPAMLEVLSERVPGVRTLVARAEEPCVPDRSVDVVVVAAAFHRFDPEEALPTIARALRPGGHLALVWNERDTRIPWVRRLGRLLDGPPEEREPLRDVLVRSPLFSFVEEKTFKAWQDVNAETVRHLVLSHSHVAGLPPEEQEDVVADVRDLYAEYGRGMDGMQLPHLVRCLRTQVVHQPGLFGEGAEPTPEPPATGAAGEPDSGDDAGDDAEAARRARSRERFLSDGTDTDMLLIDFR
ncbi:class I SAM-dependent methyltransferase [Nocardioides solisilvae]|uniref:class I SAM-dependent methyltransferase n=1 Tax=Nocardioides solisilvae TaxID=1542435 RepID=UPI000D749C7E|nr:class I SAM-dependent methyltransferase [Nocardioides solisilvae]